MELIELIENYLGRKVGVDELLEKVLEELSEKWDRNME